MDAKKIFSSIVSNNVKISMVAKKIFEEIMAKNKQKKTFITFSTIQIFTMVKNKQKKNIYCFIMITIILNTYSKGSEVISR